MKRNFAVWTVILAVLWSFGGVAGAQDNGKKSQLVGLIRTLGYGGAIHEFENYVLRGDQKALAASKANFERSQQILADLGKGRKLSPDEKSALAEIAKVVKLYQDRLTVAQGLRKQGKTVEKIDAATVVNDASAMVALATLRESHQWSAFEELEFQLMQSGGIRGFRHFVLRADEQYRAKAATGLSGLVPVITRCRASADLTEARKKALDKIESVVRAYQEAMPTVEKLIGEGKTASEIDAAVRVDDAPALAGLRALRQ